MTYPSSFASLPDVQALGPLGVPVYSSASALALEQSIVIPGQIVGIQNPQFTLAMAVGVQPASYLATSTSSTQLAGGGAQVWWVQITSPAASAQSVPYTARAVATYVAAYGGTTTGTLTCSHNGAITDSTYGLLCGVNATTTTGPVLAVGDQIFIPAGKLGPSSAAFPGADAGSWTIVSLGGSGSKWQITRPAWFATGSKPVSSTVIKVGGEDAIYGNTNWRMTAASGKIVDTDDLAFYVERFTFQATLTSGTLALTATAPITNTTPLASTTCAMPVGIFSASRTGIFVQPSVLTTLTSCVGFGVTVAATPGTVGTAAVTVSAVATNYAADGTFVGAVNVTVVNF